MGKHKRQGISRRQGIVLFILLASFILLFSGRYLARQAASYLISTDVLEPADAIVVLGAYAPDRMMTAVDLYQQGYAPYIVLSMEERPSTIVFDKMAELSVVIPETHDISLSIATQRGLSPSAVLITETRANSTRMEARNLRPLLEQHQIRSIIAVTSKTHTKRTSRIFRQELGDDIRVIMQVSSYDEFNPETWWQTRWQARSMLYEYLKLIDFIWISAIGSVEREE
jgi:uncharacterized SAM-binding protein YcdF (DUF218 family)